MAKRRPVSSTPSSSSTSSSSSDSSSSSSSDSSSNSSSSGSDSSPSSSESPQNRPHKQVARRSPAVEAAKKSRRPSQRQRSPPPRSPPPRHSPPERHPRRRDLDPESPPRKRRAGHDAAPAQHEAPPRRRLAPAGSPTADAHASRRRSDRDDNGQHGDLQPPSKYASRREREGEEDRRAPREVRRNGRSVDDDDGRGHDKRRHKEPHTQHKSRERVHSGSPRQERQHQRHRGEGHNKHQAASGFDGSLPPPPPAPAVPPSRQHDRQHGKESSKEGGGKRKADKPPEPDFGYSGKLAEETNKVNGVVLIHNEPPESRKPTMKWRLYTFKGGELFGAPLYIHRQSCYLFGRERRVVDVPTDHPSCSKQHAVIQFRLTEKEAPDGMVSSATRPYVMDLGSTNGTFLNKERIESQKYYELLEQDVLQFGNSSREYVLLHDKSAG